MGLEEVVWEVEDEMGRFMKEFRLCRATALHLPHRQSHRRRRL